MKAFRCLVFLVSFALAFPLNAPANTLAGSGDPFTLNFDENGNGLIDLRDGNGFQVLEGVLAPDPTQAGNPLVLTYDLPTSPFPVVNGDVRIWEDVNQTILSDVLRFTDANGNLTGQTADRMIFYSDVEVGEPNLDSADTGFPAVLHPNDAGGILEMGPEGNNGFQWAPGGPLDNIFNGISDVPEPSALALLGLGVAAVWLKALRRRGLKGRPIQVSLVAASMTVSITASRADSYTITLQPGYNLIANQLDNVIGDAGKEADGPEAPLIDNRIVTLLTNLPVGSIALKFISDSYPFDPNLNPDSYQGLTNGPTGWSDPQSDITMDPGEGIFLYNPLAIPLVITFTGDPHIPYLPVNLPLASVRLMSNQTNAPAAYEDITGMSAPDGTVLSRWDGYAQNFINYTNFGGIWSPAIPALAVGEAAFLAPGDLLPKVAPTIVINPLPQTKIVGQSATFSALAVGIPLPTYQWLKDGANIGGATGRTLTLNNVQLADRGLYSVKVSNAGGTVQSPVTFLVVSPNPPAGRFTVVNVIPNSESSEVEQNAEPNIAVNPNNSAQEVISSFKAASPFPYFASVNGGTVWTDFNQINHLDTVVTWNTDGKLLATIMFNGGNSIEVRSATPPPFNGTTLNTVEPNSTYNGGAISGVDQPWLEATVVGGQQRLYVGFSDWDQKPVVASLHYTDPSVGGPGNPWIQRAIDRAPIRHDPPGVRPTVVQSRVYAIFTRLNNKQGTDFTSGRVVIVRDDQGGDTTQAGGEFRALGANGVDVPDATDRNNPNGRLGNQRLQSRIAIAANPVNSNIVCVAFTTGTATKPQLQVVLSEDGGATWTPTRGLHVKTTMPALAIAADGTIGLLYTGLTDAGRFETHFSQFTPAQLKNRFCDRTDSVLCTFPDGTPGLAGNPYIGDYEDLQSVSNMFYGTFSAANDPDPANYPEGVYFQRNVKIGANVQKNFFLTAKGKLVDNAGADLPDTVANPKGVSIDPYFFCTPTLSSSNTIPPTDVVGGAWLQRPDLTCWGMDVLCTDSGNSKIVADDFRLPTSTAITSIDIWGSWQNDALDTNAAFELRIWDDVPATNNIPSHPGQLLWSQIFPAGEPYILSLTASNVCTERFFDPVTNQIVGTDTRVYRYHFNVPLGLAFTVTSNKVYWLSTTAFQTANNFGWKTCITNDHFQDDGVFGPTQIPATNQWKDLHYPPTHPLSPLTADLAFALNSTVVVDKWLQIPDTSTNGLDVRATLPKVLADDFLCNYTGPITQITIWGSWLDDQVPPSPCFCLGIWSDAPASTNGPSHPNFPLWTECFAPGQYIYFPYTNGVHEWFYQPCSLAGASGILGMDTTIWQYTFSIPPELAFWQTNNTVYWLSVVADCFDTNSFLFGWKSCPTNWNDDAVCGDTDAFGNALGNWSDMHRPGSTNSLDLSFDLTTTLGGQLPPGMAGPAVQPTPPGLAIQQNAGHLTISWSGTGTLQWAPEVTGPWTSLPGVSNPYSVPQNLPRCFYRIVSQ
jgi:hypothetical protein